MRAPGESGVSLAMAAQRRDNSQRRDISAESHLSWLAQPAVLAAAARAECWSALASAPEARREQGAVDKANSRDRDATTRLRKAVDATVSSMLLTGYDRAEIGETIRGFMLNALASASVPASVVDEILADVAMWVQRRLERTSRRP
jgi:hypothetical protein